MAVDRIADTAQGDMPRCGCALPMNQTGEKANREPEGVITMDVEHLRRNFDSVLNVVGNGGVVQVGVPAKGEGFDGTLTYIQPIFMLVPVRKFEALERLRRHVEHVCRYLGLVLEGKAGLRL